MPYYLLHAGTNLTHLFPSILLNSSVYVNNSIMYILCEILPSFHCATLVIISQQVLCIRCFDFPFFGGISPIFSPIWSPSNSHSTLYPPPNGMVKANTCYTCCSCYVTGQGDTLEGKHNLPSTGAHSHPWLAQCDWQGRESMTTLPSRQQDNFALLTSGHWQLWHHQTCNHFTIRQNFSVVTKFSM